MAKKINKPLPEEVFTENISDESLDNIMGDRYAVYAKYVIQDRAIPDVRDGLKPVQRRIIYAMYQTGNTYEKPTRKCAKIVGDVMGRFHPHGDTSIYEALVRMSQDWKMSVPLITFQGNNGSIDNDGAAAYRYTEARLNKFSENLINDIDKNTVDMTLNFDDVEFEPTVLPCRYPNLFVNGSDGIAVAIATYIPPHNLNEMCEAVIYRIQNPKCDLDSLMEIVKGPDFPTGGVMYDTSGIRELYETGHGKIELAAKLDIDTSDKNVNKIIISEIPYGVVKKQLAYQIDLIKKSKEVDGILEVSDLSAGDYIKIVVEVKKEANIDVITTYLMNKTQLKISLSGNVTAICDKHPETLTLMSYLDYYIDYQVEIITRKSKFLLAKSKARLEIVDGLIKAINIIDEVVSTIRASKDKADAKLNISKKFGFSEIQAEAIVTMQLYRISNTDINIYINERDSLNKQIKDLEETLSSPRKLKSIIIADLREIIKEFGVERRTKIIQKQDDVQIDKRDLIAKEDVYITITEDGYLKKLTLRALNANLGTLPGVKAYDSVVMSQVANTVDFIMCITSKGNYILVPTHTIPEGKWKDEGKHMNAICTLPIDERIVKCFVFKTLDANLEICTVTKKGQIKKSMLEEFVTTKFNKTITCMKLGIDDEVADACICHGNTDLFIVASNGKAGFFNENDLLNTRIRTSGMKALAGLKDSEVVSIIPLKKNERAKILYVTDNGYYRVVDSSNLELRSRLEKIDPVIKAFKSEPHNIVYGMKLDKNAKEVEINAVLNDSTVQTFKLDDLSTFRDARICKKNIDGLSDKKSIKKIYTYAVETIDENTYVDDIKPVPPLGIWPGMKQNGENKPRDDVKIPIIDTSVKVTRIDSDEVFEDERVEQISIFDDMGD